MTKEEIEKDYLKAKKVYKDGNIQKMKCAKKTIGSLALNDGAGFSV